MNTEWMLFAFVCGILLIAVCVILGTIKIFCKPPAGQNNAEEWYNHKFEQLVGLFSTGLVFFTIVVSFLALIPRYDYEMVRADIQRLDRNNEKIRNMVENAFNDQFRKVIEDTIAKQIAIAKKELKEEHAQQMKDNATLLKEFEKALTDIKGIVIKDMPLTDRKTVDIKIPQVMIPKVETPEVKIPRVEVPRVAIPKIEI